MGERCSFGAGDWKDELASRRASEDRRWHRFREAKMGVSGIKMFRQN